MVSVNAIMVEVSDEIDRAMFKFPLFPTDPLHALAVLGGKYGELNKAVLQGVYQPDKVTPEQIREEAIQTAAMAVRFIASLDQYLYLKSFQHVDPLHP